MALKTVLLHLNDRRRAEGLIVAAQAVADAWLAHVQGLHVYSIVPPVGPVLVPYGDDVMDSVRQSALQEDEAISQTFHRLTAQMEGRASWLSECAPGPDLAEHVMTFGRCADLIVASVADPDWDMAPALEFPERLVVESGRPVLLVPNNGGFDGLRRHAVVAWNGGRECARAGFDALALLHAPVRLTVLVVDDGSGVEAAMASAARFCQAAGRHEFQASVQQAQSAGRSVGETIAAEAAGLGADLLVMGAFGRSRFREFVFGGATRHITHHMTIPTLLSH